MANPNSTKLRLVCFLVCLFGTTRAFAQPPIVWEHETVAQVPDLALSHQTVLLAASTGTELVVQARQRTTGDLVWEDRAPQANPCCGPAHLASLPETAYVASSANGLTGLTRVRGYAVATGALLWEDLWTPGLGGVSALIATRRGLVVLARSSRNIGIRAYDPVTGAILWEHILTENGDLTIAWAVDEQGARIVVAASREDSITGARDLRLRAVDVRTGAIDWDITRVDVSAYVGALQVIAGRVVIAGWTHQQDSRPYVAVFRLKTGEFLWGDMAPDQGQYMAVTARGGALVAVGLSAGRILVRRYDLASGALGWEDRPAGLPGWNDVAHAVVMHEDTVYVTGTRGRLRFVGEGTQRDAELVLRAYRAEDGVLHWTDGGRQPAGVNTEGLGLALGPHRLFVAGMVADHPFLRAYDIRGDAAPAEDN